MFEKLFAMRQLFSQCFKKLRKQVIKERAVNKTKKFHQIIKY